jgi:hypothetical protein
MTAYIMIGPAHSELIICEDTTTRVVLVEVNARFHNAKVGPLVRAACGLDTIAATADSVLADPAAWDAIPAEPSLKCAAKLVHLVCSVSGELRELQGRADLEALPTCLEMEIYPNFANQGARLEPTTDIKTDAGFLLLAGEADDVQRDYAAVLRIQRDLFVLQKKDSG